MSLVSGSYSPADDPLLAKRKVLIGTMIDDDSARLIIAKLLYLNMQDSNAPIALYIKSPGGSVPATLAIVDTIIGLHTPVHTRSISNCQGTALWILAVGSSGQRRTTKDTVLSIEPTELRSPNPQSRAHVYRKKLDERMANILSRHTKLTQTEVLQALTTGKHFTAQEALAAGIVDAII